MLNIEAGTGTILDVARSLRKGRLTKSERTRVPKGNLAGQTLRHAENLCNLCDEAFAWVLAHELSAERAALVGEFIDEPPHQIAALAAVERIGPANARQAQEIVLSLRDGLIARKRDSMQPNLFDGPQYVDLAETSARLADATEKYLRTRKAAFVSAASNATDLEDVGNVLVTDKNQIEAGDCGLLLAYFEKFQRLAGTNTRTALNAATGAFYAGACPMSSAIERVVDAIRRDMPPGAARQNTTVMDDQPVGTGAVGHDVGGTDQADAPPNTITG